MTYGRPGGDGGASGAVYGCAAAAVIGGLIAVPVIMAAGVALGLYLRYFRITFPATLAWALAFHPSETWQLFVNLPDIIWYHWHIWLPNTLVGQLFSIAYDTWPGFIVINLVGLGLLANVVQSVSEGLREG